MSFSSDPAILMWLQARACVCVCAGPCIVCFILHKKFKSTRWRNWWHTILIEFTHWGSLDLLLLPFLMPASTVNEQEKGGNRGRKQPDNNAANIITHIFHNSKSTFRSNSSQKNFQKKQEFYFCFRISVCICVCLRVCVCDGGGQTGITCSTSTFTLKALFVASLLAIHSIRAIRTSSDCC